MSSTEPHQTEWLAIREHVRKRPGMYIGPLADGIRQVACELAANTIDCFLAGSATRLAVKIRGRSITVKDDGPGLPFDEIPAGEPQSLAERYLTSYQSTPTADGHAPHCHLVHLGVGVAVVNALCSTFSVESWRDGMCWKVQFRKGIPTGKPERFPTNRRRSGTKFKAVLDTEIFGDIDSNPASMRALLFQAAHLHPGLRISFNGERFRSKGGLADLISVVEAGQRDSRIFNASIRHGEYMIHAAASDAGGILMVSSWVNGVRTVAGGSHEKGFIDALRYVKWEPNIFLIHVVMLDPQFAGPTRSSLRNSDARKAVRKALKPLLTDFLKTRA